MVRLTVTKGDDTVQPLKGCTCQSVRFTLWVAHPLRTQPGPCESEEVEGRQRVAQSAASPLAVPRPGAVETSFSASPTPRLAPRENRHCEVPDIAALTTTARPLSGRQCVAAGAV